MVAPRYLISLCFPRFHFSLQFGHFTHQVYRKILFSCGVTEKFSPPTSAHAAPAAAASRSAPSRASPPTPPATAPPPSTGVPSQAAVDPGTGTPPPTEAPRETHHPTFRLTTRGPLPRRTTLCFSWIVTSTREGVWSVWIKSLLLSSQICPKIERDPPPHAGSWGIPRTWWVSARSLPPSGWLQTKSGWGGG